MEDLFECHADTTAVMEATLKHLLGEETSAEDIPPPPYLMVTTVRIDLEPQQVQLYRCAGPLLSIELYITRAFTLSHANF